MQEVQDFIKSCGYDFQATDLDGKFHEFTDTKNQKGWYVGAQLSSGKITFTFGDWRKPGEKFSYLTSANYTGDDQTELRKLTKKFEKEKADRQAQAATICSELFKRWEQAGNETTSKYIDKKKLPQHSPGTLTRKVQSGGSQLIIPMQDESGQIQNLQTIFDNGDKSYFNFARVEGTYFIFNGDPETQYVCEGFATGLAVHQSTNATVIVSFCLSNLGSVLKKFPKANILADNDHSTYESMKAKGHPDPHNPGLREAVKLAHTYKRKAFMPPGDKSVDYSDLYVTGGKDAVVKGLVEIDLSKFKIVTPSGSAQKQRTTHDHDGIYVGDIETYDDGFHYIQELKSGAFNYIPDYEGLRLYFERKHYYKILGESRICYIFNGKNYETFGDVFIENFAQEHFYPKPRNKTVFEFLKLILRTNVEATEFFNVQKKINFKNGYLDIAENKFYKHSKDVGFRYCLPYDYDPEAKAPKFEQFLDRVTLNDKGLQGLLLEFMGYALSGDSCWAQKALALTGGGSNGKSTFLNIMRYVGGEESHSPMTLSELKNEYKLQLLDGKLFNMAEETPTKSLLDSSHFKNLVSGGTVIVRQIYKAPYKTQMKAKLIFACNELPKSFDTTYAFYRRFIIVPFRATFTKDQPDFDPFIEHKLKKELSGIFNMILKAYHDLMKRGDFANVSISEQAIEDFKLETDPIRLWIHDDLKVHPLGNGHDLVWVSVQELYQEYRLYCEDSGLPAENKIVFGKRVSHLIEDYEKRIKMGGAKSQRLRGLIGITQAGGRPFKSNKLFTYGLPKGKGITAQMSLDDNEDNGAEEPGSRGAEGPGSELTY